MQVVKIMTTRKKVRAIVAKVPRWLKWVFIILLVVVIAGALIVKSNNSPLPVEGYIISQQNLERNVFASGHLKAVNEQSFFTPEDSTLMELNVKLGDRVKKGETLGRLDSMELARLYQNAAAALSRKEAELAQAEGVNNLLGLKMAEADYNKANNHYTRVKRLLQAGAANAEDMEAAQLDLARTENAYYEAKQKVYNKVSEKEIRSLRSQVNLAQQEAAQAKERLDMAILVAHFDGVVTSIGEGVKPGNRVLTGTELLTIGDDSLLEVVADVSEIDAGNLKVGQPVIVTCVALPEKTYKGQIARIGGGAVAQKTSSGESINVPVTIILKTGQGEPKIGYSADLTIQTAEEKSVITLPINAFIDRNGDKIVYLIKNSVLEERKVDIKRGNELFDIVLSGLSPGDIVVVNPSAELTNGQKVTYTTGAAK